MDNLAQLLSNAIDSPVINIVIIGILAYIALLWIAVILWVTKDITNRTDSLLLQIVCISLVIFLTPVFGLIMYLLLRPSRTIIEKCYEEMQFDQINKNTENCPSCNTRIADNFKFCPSCGQNIKAECKECKKDVLISWDNCPFCGIAIKKPEVKSIIVKNVKVLRLMKRIKRETMKILTLKQKKVKLAKQN